MVKDPFRRELGLKLWEEHYFKSFPSPNRIFYHSFEQLFPISSLLTFFRGSQSFSCSRYSVFSCKMKCFNESDRPQFVRSISHVAAIENAGGMVRWLPEKSLFNRRRNQWRMKGQNCLKLNSMMQFQEASCLESRSKTTNIFTPLNVVWSRNNLDCLGES